MASVSSPPHDALDLGPALMEVIIETAVSFSTINFDSFQLLQLLVTQHYLLYFVQFPVKVEHSDAAMVHASSPLAAVMEMKTVLMAVMRWDVVSY